MLVTPERAAHWYRWDEKVQRCLPCYELPRKDGNGTKAVTLREARELNLFWSVTRVCNCVAKPALISWQIEQAIMAALTLPRMAGEGTDAFARRVVEDMEQQAKDARGFGSLIHSQIEAELAGQLDTPDWTVKEHLDVVRSWLKENCTDIHASEIVVGDPSLGVAGKLDLDCTVKDFGRCVLDFKCRRFKDGKAPIYCEDSLQLAAYRRCRQRELALLNHPASASTYDLTPMRLVSLVIDSNPESPRVFAHWWSDEIDYEHLFIGLLNWLCFESNYDPRKPQPEKPF